MAESHTRIKMAVKNNICSSYVDISWVQVVATYETLLSLKVVTTHDDMRALSIMNILVIFTFLWNDLYGVCP